MSELMADDYFKWNESSDVVVRRVDAVAVYPNAAGDAVIRQQNDDLDADGDIFVIIPKDRIDELIAALRRVESTPPV